MLCFWLSGFFNSDAGRRVIIIIIMVGVACKTKIRRSQGLQLEYFFIEKLPLNGFQYHTGIQQHFSGVYMHVASYLVRT